ncbi:MAG: MFS transporter [Christensenellaceae bacterium]|nr:MFS transporter [Christensenellaceae bacterium]
MAFKDTVNVVKEKASFVLNDVKLHWNKPAKGNFVPYKEVALYSLGSFGYQFFLIVVGLIAFTANSTLMGSALNLKPMHLQYMNVAMSVILIFVTIFRNNIIDNTRTRIGRFRPYLIFMSVPLVAVAAIFMFLPFETWTYTTKLLVASMFVIVCTILMQFYSECVGNIGMVMTPNSDERAKIQAINAIIYSIAPSIYYAIVPKLVELFRGGFTDMNAYKFVVLPFAIAGAVFAILMGLFVKERVVLSKTFKPKVKTLRAIGDALKNKYWIIMTISTTVGFLELASANIFTWLFVYSYQNGALWGVANLVVGFSATIAMVLSPIIIKLIGVRNTKLLREGMNIICLSLMLVVREVQILILAVWWFNTLFSQLDIVLLPCMNAEMRDYQQYKCGRRLDSMLSSAAQIVAPITILSGFAVPYLYESLGLTKNYDILFDNLVRNNMFKMLFTVAIIGATMNFLPLLFYDLTRSKHTNVVKVLRVRAIFENYSVGEVDAEAVVRGIDEVREAYAIRETEDFDLSVLLKARQDAFSAIFKAEDKKLAYAAYKTARKELSKARSHNDERKNALILIDEMNKFQTPSYIWLTEVGKKLIDSGIANLEAAAIEFKTSAEKLPEKTKEEISFKRKWTAVAKRLSKTPALVAKKYPNGFVEPDETELIRTEDLPETTREERAAKTVAFTKINSELMRYDSVAHDYLEIKRIYEMSLMYARYSEIESRYDELKAQLREKEEAERIADEAKKAEKLADTERATAERFASFSPEKQARVLEKQAKKKEKRLASSANAAATLATTEEEVDELLGGNDDGEEDK